MGSKIDYLDRCDSLCLFGGTFDPVHIGHIAIANAAANSFNVQKVLFMPCGSPYHKKNNNITSAKHRYNMVLEAICEYPNLDVSAIEINRQGPTYTVDTIEEIKKLLPQHAIVYIIIGADQFLEIQTWKDSQRLLKLCEFIIVPRPGFEKKLIKKQRDKPDAAIHILDFEPIEISSTKIRKNIEKHSHLLPIGVKHYIKTHDLYNGSQDIFEKIKSEVKKRISKKRFIHTMGVVEAAERLAEIYGEDMEKARLAAVLHDIAKEYSADKKRKLCKKWQIPVDNIINESIDLAHGAIAAEIALREFDISDKDILQAIYYHTTGHKNLTMLDKIIMLSDYIDPTREEYGPLEYMRNIAHTDINKALIYGLSNTIEDEKSKGNTIHKNSINSIKILEGEINGKRSSNKTKKSS